MASSKEFETNVQLRRIFTIIRILISNRYPAKMSDIKKSLTDRDVPLPSDKTLGRDMKEIESLGYSIHLGIGKGYFLQNKEEIAGLFFYDEDVLIYLSPSDKDLAVEISGSFLLFGSLYF